ncbi:hypothetical protein [Telluribacter humicola]|uniref:hypothetical protein n=1 Tax=Telluribacter humicola TaxID=1720261 RepID=UPI001A958F97|nr:hypothetical protein [Telluribacter humicola]
MPDYKNVLSAFEKMSLADIAIIRDEAKALSESMKQSKEITPDKAKALEYDNEATQYNDLSRLAEVFIKRKVHELRQMM